MENTKVIVTMGIKVIDGDGNEVVVINNRDFEYRIDEANNFYLYRIKNFVSNRLEVASNKIGKATIDKWKGLIGHIESIIKNREAAKKAPVQLSATVEKKVEAPDALVEEKPKAKKPATKKKVAK